MCSISFVRDVTELSTLNRCIFCVVGVCVWWCESEGGCPYVTIREQHITGERFKGIRISHIFLPVTSYADLLTSSDSDLLHIFRSLYLPSPKVTESIPHLIANDVNRVITLQKRSSPLFLAPLPSSFYLSLSLLFCLIRRSEDCN